MYGPILTPAQVARGVQASLTAWFPSCLVAVARAAGLPETDVRALAFPTRHHVLAELDAVRETQFPVTVTSLPDTVETHRGGDGAYRASHRLEVICLVRGSSHDETQQRVYLYTHAAALACVAEPTHGGVATDTRWVSSAYDLLEPIGKRSLGGGGAELVVTVDRVLATGVHPDQPPEDPYAPAEPKPTVQSSDVDVQPRSS